MNRETLRKVALLVDSLDRNAADRLLEQLSVDRADAVRQAVRDLAPADRQQQRAVIQAFLRADTLAQTGSVASRAGVMPDRRSTTPRPDPHAARRFVRPTVDADAESGGKGRPIERASERLIAECLSDEMPQAIAVALAQLPAQRASEVVAHLPATLQTHVLERLVELDPANSIDAPEIRDEFHHWLNEQIARSLDRAELAARLATILEATHSGTRQKILHNVSNSDARLAKELQQQLAALDHDPSMARHPDAL